MTQAFENPSVNGLTLLYDPMDLQLRIKRVKGMIRGNTSSFAHLNLAAIKVYQQSGSGHSWLTVLLGIFGLPLSKFFRRSLLGRSACTN